jgi:phosphoserine phosphatase
MGLASWEIKVAKETRQRGNNIIRREPLAGAMGRRYDLVAFDLDGVLAEPESSWVYVHRHFRVTNKAALDAFVAGEIDDMEFMRRDISLWRRAKPGVKAGDIENILDEIKITPGAREVVQAIKATGAQTAIVSGGLRHLADRVAKFAGVDHVLANDVARDGRGALTGEGVLEVELLAKGKALEVLQRRLGVGKGRCAAVGNSFIDAQMFDVSALGIAFNPVDEEVRGKADFLVEGNDLRLILPYLVGTEAGKARRRA